MAVAVATQDHAQGTSRTRHGSAAFLARTLTESVAQLALDALLIVVVVEAVRHLVEALVAHSGLSLEWSAESRGACRQFACSGL